MGLADNAARKKPTPRKASPAPNNRPGGNSMGAPVRYTPPPRPAPQSPGTRTGAGGYTFTYQAPSSRANMTRPDQITADNHEAYDRTINRQADALLRQQTMPMGPMMTAAAGSGGGRSGGGGGGGGGGAAGGLDPAQFNAYAAQMMKLIQSGQQQMQPQVNPLTALINPAVDADIKNARGAYAGIANRISTDDPYAALRQAQSPKLDAALAAFLQGQGVGTQEYGNQLQQANAQLGAGDANWSNLAGMLGTNHVAGQRANIDATNVQGENIVQGYESQRTGLNAAAQLQQLEMNRQVELENYRRQQQAQQAMMDLMATGLQYGVTPDLSSMMGAQAAPQGAPMATPRPMSGPGWSRRPAGGTSLGSGSGGGTYSTMPVKPGAVYPPKGM